MKQQPSDSHMRPSRLCQIIFVALTLKLAILGGIFYDSLLPGNSFSGQLKDSFGLAYAAETTAAPASPESISVVVPDVGMDRSSPGVTTNPTIPGAVPGLSAPIDTKVSTSSQGNSRILPSVTRRPQQTSNSTAGITGGSTREALLLRQQELARKEEELKKLEASLGTKIEQMQGLENRIQVMMKDADVAKDGKLRHVVDVLSNMKAKQAAAVLETLDQRIGVKVLANMRGRQAGEILTFVQPEKAASLAEALSRMQLPLE